MALSDNNRFYRSPSQQMKAVSGRWTRNPMLKSMASSFYGSPASAASPTINPGADIGPPAPGIPGESAVVDPHMTGTDQAGEELGNSIALNLGKKGLSATALTAALGLGQGYSLSAMLPALGNTFAASLLGPAHLANMAIGSAITGHAAGKGEAAMEGKGLPADLESQTTMGITKGLPSTAIGHLVDWGRGKTSPSAFADEAAELAIANAPLGFTPNQALADQAAAQEATTVDEIADLVQANAPFAGGGPAGPSGGNVGTGSESGPATGRGDTDTSPGADTCIIVTACTDPYSYEVELTRLYRQFLDPVTLGGYYAIAHKIAPIIKRNSKVRVLVKRFLVDRLVDYGEVFFRLSSKYKFKSSVAVTTSFLFICKIVGNFVDVQALIRAHR